MTITTTSLLDQIRAGARAAEADHRLPYTAVRALQKSGFTALRVPVEHGGAGLDFATFVEELVELARADSNLPQLLRGHIGFVELVLASPDGPWRRRWLDDLGAGTLVGNARHPGERALAEVLIAGLDHESGQEYAAVARSRGLGTTRLLTRHLLRPSSLPVVRVLALTVGELLAGALITETIFGRAGIGSLVESAVTTQDLPVLQAVVSLAAVVFVVVNLVADLVYPLLDPRVRAPRTLSRKESSRDLSKGLSRGLSKGLSRGLSEV